MVQSSFLILQSAAWPISSEPTNEQFSLPSELETPMIKFDEFYREKHHGRKRNIFVIFFNRANF